MRCLWKPAVRIRESTESLRTAVTPFPCRSTVFSAKRESSEGLYIGLPELLRSFPNLSTGPAFLLCSTATEGPDKDGNEVNITLFANSMTERGHQRDEYAFISNALFAGFLTETPYVSAASSADQDVTTNRRVM